jgi:hypothetical protein
MKILILIGLLAVASCVKRKPESVQTVGDYEIALLFEVEGCKMFRFRDQGHHRYWANCSGSVSSHKWQQTGKTGHYDKMQSITTESKK